MKDLLRILVSARSVRPYYVAVGGFTLLLSVASLLQPLLTGWAVDELRHGTNANVRYVVYLAIGIFILDIIANVASNVGGYFGDQLSLRVNRFLSQRYYDHLLTLPQRFFDTELTGKIINQLNRSISQIANFVQAMSNTFLQFIFSTILTLVVVAHFSWQVALLMLSVYPVYLYLTAKSSPPWRVWQKEKNHHFDIASGRFAEVINQVKVVKSFIQERHEQTVFKDEFGKVLAINKPQSSYWHRHDIYRRLVLGAIFFAVYLVIFLQTANGHLSPGAAVALVLYSGQIRLPIFTISYLVDVVQRAVTDSREYLTIMDTKPEIADVPNARKLKVTDSAITFEHVQFGYDAAKPVLKDVSFTIAPRTKVALVGESGEGKSTLTNLLLRLYEPQSGRILIDGQDVTAVTQASLRSHIGVVFQEPALFSGTIRENIAYARPNAKKADIIAAAKAANAHTFIEKFEKGYDTEIGERGLRLSGGQKQRIAIARAILKDAPILILDEATSSLDSRSEHVVQEALDRLMHGRTTLIIAHRLSTIEHVDQIVTLKGGSVDETGSPAELAETGGIYAQLLALQQRHSHRDESKLHDFGIGV